MVFIVSEIVFKVEDSKVPFLGEFCSDIESISTILSIATILSAPGNKTNSSIPIFRFL